MARGPQPGSIPKLTKEQKEIFDKENPEWKQFFSDRQ